MFDLMLTRSAGPVTRLAIAALVLSLPGLAGAQQPAAAAPAPVAKLVAEPATLSLRAGTEVAFKVRALDASGRGDPRRLVRVMAGTRALRFSDTSVVASAAGRYEATAMAQGANGAPITLSIPVVVAWPALSKVEIVSSSASIFAGVSAPQKVAGWHADGSERSGLTGNWRSSNTAIATVNRFGEVTGVAPGSVTIEVESEGVRTSRAFTVTPNPVAKVEIMMPEAPMRTGDVIHLKAAARRANGAEIAGYPITWSYTYAPDDSIAPAGTPGRGGDRAVRSVRGNYPGRYTVLAQAAGA